MMNKEEIKIITLGDIFRNIETEEQAFEFLKYIKNLQQENEKLKKQYCERTDCSGRIGNSKKVEELQNENQQLKILISAREEVCDRLESNWNKLKEIAKSQSDFKLKVRNKELWFEVDELLSKMQELEQGSDSDE